MNQAELPLVTIGMGGNVGDVAAAMQWALDAIGANGSCKVQKISPVYQTAPWGLVDQPDFLNCCVSLRTPLAPLAFLDMIQKIEHDGGRVREIRWGPRTLDIDLLTYGDETIEMPRLTVPHPRMLERAFVMVPLADIEPDLMIAGQKASAHAGALDQAGMQKTGLQLII